MELKTTVAQPLFKSPSAPAVPNGEYDTHLISTEIAAVSRQLDDMISSVKEFLKQNPVR